METIRQLVEWVALGIELLAVAVIVGAILAALWPGGMRRMPGLPPPDLVRGYKQRMGRGLLLGLELLLAADIVGTVALTLTFERLASLGLLALIRSFLSWSLDVEVEGCWPWRVKAEASRTEAERAARPAGTAARE